MTINGIPNSYRAATTISAPKVKASEEGLFKPITAKVSGALSDEYIEQIKACARKAATEGTNMVSSGYAAVRDMQMGKFISPDREKAISQVSAALNDRSRVWKYGENLLDLLGIPYTASVHKGARYTTVILLIAAQAFRESLSVVAVSPARKERFPIVCMHSIDCFG